MKTPMYYNFKQTNKGFVFVLVILYLVLKYEIFRESCFINGAVIGCKKTGRINSTPRVIVYSDD